MFLCKNLSRGILHQALRSLDKMKTSYYDKDQMHDISSFRLTLFNTQFLCVDVQEKSAAALPPSLLAHLQKKIILLLKSAGVMNIPVVVTEQYSQALKHTLPDLQKVMPPDSKVFEKIEFSAFLNIDIAQAMLQHNRKQAIVFGTETHVCILQTAYDLLEAGFEVYVPEDAVASQDSASHHNALRLLDRAGAIITHTETLLFELLKKAGTPLFKTISAFVKEARHG